MTTLSEDRDRFLADIDRPQKTLVEILEEFPSIQLPPSVALCEILPKNMLRYYSISSSGLKEPNIVSITAVLVRYAIAVPNYKTKKSKVVIRGGLMTTYLERLHNERVTSLPPARNGDGLPRFYVPMYIRQSAFKLPGNNVPVIMVGPGTGAAPFRAFLWDRFTGGKSVAPTMFFYGCRDPAIDYLYRDEVTGMCEDTNFDLDVVTAYSRVVGGEKVYVQKRIAERGQRVWKLLGEGGYFYVCGDAKNMAVAVHGALEGIAESQGGMSMEEAKEWVRELKSSGRYLEDTWS